jgi:hypothetical protein
LTERRACGIAGAAAAGVSAAAFLFFYRLGATLYFGDAFAHLNIARKILDGKTPGWTEIGTVWLPLPHLLAAPLVWFDPLWRTGIGGALPSAAAFVAGAIFLFTIARRWFEDPVLPWTALALYLVNLNVLYLQSTPMNEVQAMAAFLAAVYFATQDRPVSCGATVMLGTLIRYDHWFYLPFFALYFWRAGGWRAAARFSAVAVSGPLLWLLHNYALYGNALEWYNGPYSAHAIFDRARAAGEPPHPGYHDLRTAALYYWKASQLVIGRVPLWLSVLGWFALLRLRFRHSAFCILHSAFLWLPFLFYTLSIAYGNVPLFLPQWWPFGFYNVRYAAQMLPAVALLAPAALLVLPKYRAQAALALVLFVAGGWVLGVARSRSDALVVFREAEANSLDRRYAVELVAKELGRGCTEIWLSSSDMSDAMAVAGIPFRRSIHEGNRDQWQAVSRQPETLVDCVVAQQGDGVDRAIARLPRFETSFRTVLDLKAPAVARVRVYRRR